MYIYLYVFIYVHVYVFLHLEHTILHSNCDKIQDISTTEEIQNRNGSQAADEIRI